MEKTLNLLSRVSVKIAKGAVFIIFMIILIMGLLSFLADLAANKF